MKIRLLFSVATFVSLVGCVKHEDKPSDAIMRLTEAINSRDTNLMKKVFPSWVVNRHSTLPTFDSLSPHFNAKVLKVDSSDAIANVLFSLTMTIKINKEIADSTIDSINVQTVKEDGIWKISSILNPGKFNGNNEYLPHFIY